MSTTAKPPKVEPVYVSPGAPAGRRFMFDDEDFPLDKEGLPEPHFSVQECAKAFFGRSSDWLRWRYRPDKPRKNQTSQFPDGYFILDGEPLEPKTSAKGARYYTLADIERMAHALVQTGVLDGDGFTNVLAIVKANAALHGIEIEESE
jgi:hypothetical protein